MPELPEVETTCRGIEPHIINQSIKAVVVRHRQLRWPIPRTIKSNLTNEKITSVQRRGKYILLGVSHGTVLIHLGMSGSLRIVDQHSAYEKHDHFELIFNSGKCLRLRDPRRFGAVLFSKEDPLKHKLLANLGPEPLQRGFSGKYLFEKSRNKKVTVKQFIMDSKVVGGVGNIYASEALFMAGIHPKRQAGRIPSASYKALAVAIKKVLRAALKQGGTTLRDFTHSDGQPGYFRQKLNVYGRSAEACPKCGNLIKQVTIGQRSSFFCPHCQS